MEVEFLYFSGTSKMWIPIEQDKLCLYDVNLCKETQSKILQIKQRVIQKNAQVTYRKAGKRKQRKLEGTNRKQQQK